MIFVSEGIKAKQILSAELFSLHCDSRTLNGTNFVNLLVKSELIKRFFRFLALLSRRFRHFFLQQKLIFVYKTHCCYSVFTGIDCDLDCFLTVHRDILPACDNELTGAYNALAVLDGDTVSITHLDVDLWYDVLVSVQGSGK